MLIKVARSVWWRVCLRYHSPRRYRNRWAWACDTTGRVSVVGIPKCDRLSFPGVDNNPGVLCLEGGLVDFVGDYYCSQNSCVALTCLL